MKLFNIYKYLMILLTASFAVSCISPNDPEELTGASAAGYKIISKVKVSGYANDAVINDTLAFVAQGEGGLSVISIKDPANPYVIRSFYEGLRGTSRRIEYKDKVVYLAANSFGVSVVDVQNPSNPIVIATNLEMKPARDLFLFHDFLIASISEQGVKLADVSTAATPDIGGRIQSLPGYCRSSIVTSDSILITASGEMGLGFTSLKNLLTGFEIFEPISRVDVSGYSEAVAVGDDPNYVYAACGTFGLAVINISDIKKPKVESYASAGGTADDIIIDGNTAILAAGTRGIQFFDISDKLNPKYLGTIPTSNCKSVNKRGDFIYATDNNDGLIILGKEVVMY